MNEIRRVCVFCASSSKIRDVYKDAARELGKELAKSDIAINYGGGAVGLMGELANAMLENGGDVTGIIPRFMVEVEWEHKSVKKMIYVDTMAERKKLLVENVDAVITLPGGTGTLEELFEVLSNKKLGLFSKPVVLLNINGFFDPLIGMLKKIVDEDFMKREFCELYTIVNNEKDVVMALQNIEPWSCEDLKYAAI